jgi:hypothetical protein
MRITKVSLIFLLSISFAYNIERIPLQNNTLNTNFLGPNSSKSNHVVSFNIWDDVAALGVWFIILIIFGPTAVIAIIVFHCIKNVCFRQNPSPLLG